jgi:hypothetical protein
MQALLMVVGAWGIASFFGGRWTDQLGNWENFGNIYFWGV